MSIELFSNTREVVLQVGFSLRVWPSLLSLPPSRSPAAAGPFKGPRAPFGSSQSTMASKRRQDGRRRSRTGQQQRQEAVNPAGASGPLALGARPAAARSFSGAVASAAFVVAAAAVVVSVVLPPAAECAPAAAAAAADACQNNPYCFYGGEKRMSQMRYTQEPPRFAHLGVFVLLSPFLIFLTGLKSRAWLRRKRTGYRSRSQQRSACHRCG